MTVKELIDELKLYDENLEVYTEDDEQIVSVYPYKNEFVYLETN